MYDHRKRPDKLEKQLYLYKYKKDRGCSQCGYDKCVQALEFDHIDRSKKNFRMSRAYHYSWKKLQEELQNCIILCANCHREKTIREKDYQELDFEELEDLQLSLL